MRVLIVDNSTPDQESMTRLLEGAFDDVVASTVDTPDTYAQALGAESVDIVLTEHALSWTDGLAVLHDVQQRWPHVPVIMVTHAGSETLAVEGLKAGLTDYVPKQHIKRLPEAVRVALTDHPTPQHHGQAALRDSERDNRILRGINRIFEQAIRAETEEVLGKTCLAVALEVTGSQYGFIGEVGADGLLHDIAVSDTGWEHCMMHDQTGHRRPPGDFALHGLYGRIVDEGAGLFTSDPPSHPDSTGLPAGHPPLACFLGVPLKQAGKTIGVLAVANRSGGYTREQQESLDALVPAMVEALYRKRAEQALQRLKDDLEARVAQRRAELLRTETRYRTLFESIDEGFCVIEVVFDDADRAVDYRFLEVNPAFQQQSGIENAVGRRMRDIAPDHEEHWFEVYGRVAQTGEPVRLERPARALDRFVDVYAFRVGRPEQRRVAVLFTDITKRKQVEADRDRLLAEVRRQQQLLERVLAASPVGIAVVRGPEYRYELVNPAYHAIPGTPYIEMLGRTFAEVFPKAVAQGVLDLYEHAYRTGESVSVREYASEVGPDHEETFWNVDLIPLRDAEGQVDSVLVLTHSVTEEVRARQEIEKQRAQLEAVLRQLPSGVIIAEVPSGRLLLANAQVDTIWRHPFSAATTAGDYTAYRGFHPDGRPYAPEEWPLARSIQAGEVVAKEQITIQRGDGTRGTILVSSTPVTDPQGSIVSAVAVFQDITERKWAEDALHMSEERFRLAASAARIGAYTRNLRTGEDYWSPEFLAIYGLSRDEPLALKDAIPAAVHPDDREQVLAAAQARLQHTTDPAFSSEHRILRPDGEIRWVLIRGRVEFSPQGEPVGTYGIAMDITERKVAEQALRENEAMLNTILDALPVGLVIADATGGIVRANAAYNELWGIPPETTSWEAYANWVGYWPETGERIKAYEWAVSRALLAGETTVGELVECEQFGTGEHRFYVNNVAPVRNPAGGIVGAVGAVLDVTEQRQAQAQLQRYTKELEAVNKANRMLLREVNHRVKNTLTAILGLILAEERRLGTEAAAAQGLLPCRTTLNDLGDRVRSLATVHGLLSSGQWRPLRIDVLVEEIIRESLPAAVDSQSLLLEITGAPVLLTPEQAQHLALIVSELTTNTVKHGRGVGKLHVRVDVAFEDGQVQMTYRNNGRDYPERVLQGVGYSVGLELIDKIATHSLRGTWSLRNDEGPVAEIRFPAATELGGSAPSPMLRLKEDEEPQESK